MIPNSAANLETALAFRWYVCGLWIIKLLLDPLQELSLLPKSAYTPIGMLRIFSGDAWSLFYDERFLILLRVVGIIALYGAARWAHTGPVRLGSLLLACGVLILYQSLVRAVGAINHTETTLLFPIYAMLVSEVAQMCPNRIGHSGQRQFTPGLPIVITMAAVCCSYSFAGVHRLVVGGLGSFTSGIMTYWCVWRGLDTPFLDSTYGALVTSNDLLRWTMEFGFPLVTLMEAGAILCLVWPAFRVPFVVTMIGFHAGTLVMMGILFWEPVVLFVTFFDMAWMGRVRQYFVDVGWTRTRRVSSA